LFLSAVMSGSQPAELPDQLCCPITHDLFRDPVFAVSGNTYDRDAITGFWKFVKSPRDPRTNEVLECTKLITNWDMRRQVVAWLDQNPGSRPPGWVAPVVRKVCPVGENGRIEQLRGKAAWWGMFSAKALLHGMLFYLRSPHGAWGILLLMHIVQRQPACGSARSRVLRRLLQLLFYTPLAISSFYVVSCCTLAVKKELGMIVGAMRVSRRL